MISLNQKTEQIETQKLWEEFKNYSRYDEMKDLYAKVLPPIQLFQDQM